MRNFDFGEAFTAGFRLIGRRPIAVGMWGLVYLLIGVIPGMIVQIATMQSGLPDASAAAANPGAVVLQLIVQLITALIATGILLNAIYRSVLEPEDRGFFAIRIGKAEFLQMLVQLCVQLVVVIAFVALLLASVSMGGVGFLFFFVVGLLLWALAVRFLLAGPMTFAERRFRLVQSWSLTAGHWLKAFGLSFVLIVTVFVLYLIFVAIFVLIMMLVAGGAGAFSNPDALTRTLSEGGGGPLLAVLGLAFLILFIFVIGAVFTIVLAPWAEVYRQLAGGKVDAETFA